MKRSPLSAVVIALTLTSCALWTNNTDGLTPPASKMFLASTVIQHLYEIQREYQVETVRCLIGNRDGDTIHVLTAVPAWINEASALHVSFQLCDAENVIGWYHNHPPDSHAPQYVACVMSEEDVRTLLFVPAFEVGIITCDMPNTLTFMFKGDRRIYRWSGNPPRPTPGGEPLG